MRAACPLLKALEPELDTAAMTALGVPVRDVLAETPPPGGWQTTIRTLDAPLGGRGALAVLHGSLKPDGAVLKAAAASEKLMRHRGPAMVVGARKTPCA